MPTVHRRALLLTLCLATALPLAGCRLSTTRRADMPAATADTAALRRTLTSLMDESAAAWNRADLAGHVAMYTDSASFMGAKGPVIGRETIRASLERGFWRDGRPRGQLAFSELRVWPLGERHALMTGAFLLTYPEGRTQSGRYSLVWVQENGQWRIVHDHSG